MFPDILTSISRRSKNLLTMRFGLQHIDQNSFVRRVAASGLQQADVVLVLLSENFLTDVERIIGKPITYLPSIPPLPHRPLPRRKPDYILILNTNPPVSRERKQRWTLVRDGASVKNLLMLGVKKRDIRSWTKRQYIRVIHDENRSP